MSGVRFLLIITKFIVSELKSTHVRDTAHREFHELLFIFFLDVPVIVIAVNGFINHCLLFLPLLLTIITPSFVISKHCPSCPHQTRQLQLSFMEIVVLTHLAQPLFGAFCRWFQDCPTLGTHWFGW